MFATVVSERIEEALTGVVVVLLRVEEVQQLLCPSRMMMAWPARKTGFAGPPQTSHRGEHLKVWFPNPFGLKIAVALRCPGSSRLWRRIEAGSSAQSSQTKHEKGPRRMVSRTRMFRVDLLRTVAAQVDVPGWPVSYGDWRLRIPRPARLNSNSVTGDPKCETLELQVGEQINHWEVVIVEGAEPRPVSPVDARATRA